MDTPHSPDGRKLDGFTKRVRRQPVEDTVMPAGPQFVTKPLGDEPELIGPEAPMPANPLETSPAVPPIQPGSDPSPRLKPAKPVKKRRHVARWIALVITVVLLGVGGWLAYSTWNALHNIIQKHTGTSALDGDLDLSSLKGEGSGRVNILVMGIGGEGHEGPNLSDTMIVWSIDPKTYDVAAISVPRDLYVKIQNNGYGKINSANAYGGPAAAEKAVNTVLGITVNYYAVVDFSGFQSAVDAVGGIDIDVPTALYDKQYPCETGNKVCPYNQAAGHVHMSGAQALKYARCRHNDYGIGNCGNDYGRSARQQAVLAALKTKALSLGTLTNPKKLTSLIGAVGDHVKTDLQLSDMKKLAQLATKIDSSKIVNKVLDDEPDNYLVGGTNIIPAAGYIYVPKLGNFDYDDIHDFVTNIFVDRYITSENARLEVLNGSGVTGVAGRVVTSLTAAHYNVGPAANADATVDKTVIYDYTNGKKPYTIKYLEQRFGVKAQKATPTPTPSVSPTVTPVSTATVQPTQIRIILGRDYATTSTSSSSSN